MDPVEKTTDADACVQLQHGLKRPRHESDNRGASARGVEVTDTSEKTSVTSGESSDAESVVQRPAASLRLPRAGGRSYSCGDPMAGNSSTHSEQRTVPLHQRGVHSFEDEFELALISRRTKRVLLSRLQDTFTNPRLSLINLSRRGLDEDDAGLLREAILSNPTLSVLILSYNELGDRGCAILSSAVVQGGVHHQHLSVLDLGFNYIGDEGCEALAVNVLAGNMGVHTLFLSGNHIREKGILSIAGAIVHGTGLRRLLLSANLIGPVGIKTLSGAIVESDARIPSEQEMSDCPGPKRGLQELDLGSSGISGEGFIAVPGLLLTSKTITSISLANNNLGDPELNLLAQALTHNKQAPLKDLVLSFNNITCSGVEDLMNAIWGSETLKQIKLDNNRVQDRGAQLCAVVLTAVALEILDISCNPVSPVGIKALMKNISENDSLVSLGLCSISMDLNGAKAISYALAYNSSLDRIFMDKCEAGYTAQRHVVAGIISNRKSSLRLFTGFPIGPIAATLGIPSLPAEWSNDQVLGFFRMMWQQWLLKAGRGRVDKDIRGPAPPAAVAAAAKVALASLGSATLNLFQTQPCDKPIAEKPPVDPSNTSLLERSNSGNLIEPSFPSTVEEELSEWAEAGSKSASAATAALTVAPPIRGPLDDPEKRNRCLHWLRENFRVLNDIGQLPFNNADLWQLHQHYFSPPNSSTKGEEASQPTSPSTAIRRDPPPTPSISPAQMGRAISFHSLGNALAASEEGNHKRRTGDGMHTSAQPASKRSKGLKERIAYYPRILTKIKSLGSRPQNESLSLFRQLKFTESALFHARDPYAEILSSSDVDSSLPSHADVEMILLDLM